VYHTPVAMIPLIETDRIFCEVRTEIQEMILQRRQRILSVLLDENECISAEYRARNAS
jgi:hypothetical protein